MRTTKLERNYISSRKKLLKEYKKLIYERTKLTNWLRSVKREVDMLDNYLLNDSEKTIKN